MNIEKENTQPEDKGPSTIRKVFWNDPDLKRPKNQALPIARNTDLYSSRLGKRILEVGATAAFSGTELLRMTRDRLVTLTAMRSYTARENGLIKDGLGIEIVMPVRMPRTDDWDNALARASKAVRNLVEEGRIEHRRRIPPGRQSKGEKGRQIPISGSRLVQSTAEKIVRGFPIARMTIVPDTIEITTRSLVEQGDENLSAITKIPKLEKRGRISQTLTRFGLKKEEVEEMAFMMLPRVNVNIQIAHMHPQVANRLKVTQLDFPLGYVPLKFNENGQITDPPYTVGGKVYHPALLGLDDFSTIVSEVISERTNRWATVDPQSIQEGLVAGKNADAPVSDFINPHFERMYAIEKLGSLITQMPAEMVMSLHNTMILTDSEGNLHPDSAEIWTEFTERVLGFKKLEPGEIRPSNWTRFIETFHQTCTKNEAYATWGGGHTAIYPFLQQTRSMNEVKEFFGNQATEKSEVLDHILNHKDKPTPAPAALLLASNTAPINLLLDIQAQVAAGETAAMMGREANIRQLEAAKTITRIARTTTIEVEEYWRRYEETYYREIRRLARIGAQRGKIGGDNIVSSYSGEISAEGGQSLPKDTQPRSFPRIKR